MRRSTILAGGLALFCSLTACSTVPAHSGSKNLQAPPFDLQVTPFPYNSDIFGDDLPVEIGRFKAPAFEGSDTQIEIGYVRYPAVEGRNGSPIVILSSQNPATPVRQSLYTKLREIGDVIVLSRRGFGFSSPPPPCPGRLNYPFLKPLTITELRENTSAFSRKCLEFLTDAGYDARAYSYKEVANDLAALKEILGASELMLVAEGTAAIPAIAALSQQPHRYSRLVLINPQVPSEVSEGVLMEHFRNLDALHDPGFSVSLAQSVRALSTRFRSTPQKVEVISRSGREITIAIGELDLAFLCVRAAFAGGDYLLKLADGLANAVNGRFETIARLILEMRQDLGLPSSASILISSASSAPAEPTLHYTPIEYAITWPAPSPPKAFQQRDPKRVETATLVIKDVAALSNSGSFTDGFSNHRTIELHHGSAEWPSELSLSQLIVQFLSGAIDLSSKDTDASEMPAG